MFLLDTNIISKMYKGEQKIFEKMSEVPFSQLKTTAIVTSEIFYGVYKHPNPEKQKRLYNYYIDFFKEIEIVHFDYSQSQIFAKLKYEFQKAGKTIEEADLMIASACLTKDYVLITNNLKDFKNIQGLKVEDWST